MVTKWKLGAGWVFFLILALPQAAIHGQEAPAGGSGNPASSYQTAPGIPDNDAQIAAEIEFYWSLMEKYPTDASLHVNLGNLYALWGWSRQALDEYEKAIKLSPRDPIAWTNLGTLSQTLGKSSKAIDAFKKAIHYNPNASLAYYNLGILYQNRGKYDKSVENYKQAIQLNPDLASIEKNPHIAHNTVISVVLLEQYHEKSENLSLPLQWIPRPRPEE